MTKRAKTKRLSYALGILLIVSGCSSTHFSNPPVVQPSLPGGGQPTTSNAYIGTQNPGYWSLTLDNSQKVFSYQPVTYAPSPNPPTQGSFVNQNNILNFGTVNGNSAGMAVEMPSQVTTLRPGDNTTAPISMVQAPDCFAITGNVRFIFTGIISQQPQPSDSDTTYPAYGAMVASTSPDGKTWQFGDVRGYQLPDIATAAGIPVSLADPVSLANDPLTYTATCAAANGQAVITADTDPAFTVLPTFAFHPAGYFVKDRSPSDTSSVIAVGYSFGWAGVIMPSSPLQPSDIASVSYRGFVYEPVPNITTVTQPIALAPSPASNGTLVGGTYPNDDPTQSPGAQYTINLGKQDATLNGVFPNATLVMSDPQRICGLVNQNGSGIVSPGFDANGNSICTTKGVVVAGKPEDKYVIYFTALDGTADVNEVLGANQAYTLQMYLYQQ